MTLKVAAGCNAVPFSLYRVENTAWSPHLVILCPLLPPPPVAARLNVGEYPTHWFLALAKLSQKSSTELVWFFDI